MQSETATTTKTKDHLRNIKGKAGKKLATLLEPRVDVSNGCLDVGGYVIPQTSLLTALLFGFAENPNWRAREYYFWRICDELWNHEDLPEPMMEPNPWAKQMIRLALQEKYVAIGGAASSSKSHTMAAWGIVNWLADPSKTLVLITSTTLREARKRIWGSIISLMSVIEDIAPCKIRDSIGSIAYVNENGTLFDKAGLSLIAAERSRTREAVGKFIGIKQKRVILIGDELSELSPAIIEAGLSNLSKNDFQMIGMSNPNSRFDAFGVWAEPKGGWNAVDIMVADKWPTKYGGQYIRLDGERSPNILAGETRYPYLPTAEKVAEDKSVLGETSRGYMRMVRAIFFDSDEDDAIYTEAELAKSGALGEAKWASTPTLVAGLDPAFTNGGDRTILYTAKVGLLDNGQFAFEFSESHTLVDDATDKTMPRSYQIVQAVKNLCKKLGVPPENLAVDSTGAGGPFCDILAGEWDSSFMRVSFGAKASDKRVSANSTLIGEELYVNRVSELWFVGKELMRTGQIKGVSGELAKEMCGRTYDLTKGSVALRVKIESKPEFKSRLGMSPDLADAGFLALDCARQRFGLVAIELPKDEEGLHRAFKAPPRSMRSISAATMNSDSYLP